MFEEIIKITFKSNENIDNFLNNKDIQIISIERNKENTVIHYIAY